MTGTINTFLERHRSFLTSEGLLPIGKLGREEVFTGVLASALLNHRSRDIVFPALGIKNKGWRLRHVYSAVEPVDLVMILENRSGQQFGYVLEIKWRGSKSNAPGYRSYPAGLDPWDQAPYQIDRAHEVVMTAASRREDAAMVCPHCSYPQICPTHGCMRNCGSDSSRTVSPWTQWPKRYPAQGGSCGLAKVVTKHPTIGRSRWSFHLLDYSDRSVDDAFPGGICNGSWKSKKMSALAGVLQRGYVQAQRGPERDALEPLLRTIYCDDLA